MGICSVFECKNNTRKKLVGATSFHKFPKQNPKLAKQWVLFCKRKVKINIETARICSLHFMNDDFINNTQFEMGFTSYRILKPDAIPTIRLKVPTEETAKATARSKRMQSKKNKELLKDLLEDSAPVESEPETEIKFEHISLRPNFSDSELLSPNITEISNLNAEIKTLREENENLKQKLLIAEEKITSFEKIEFHQKNLEGKLLEIFTTGQIKKLKSGSFKRSIWSEEDITKSITLYSTSSRIYKLLKRKKFPLPAVRTLQTWVQKLDISPGIMKPIIKIMKADNELTRNQKLCVLSFDEMKIKEAYCYDRSTDTTLRPAFYVQVGMIRGLIGNWKQPIFYDFDCKMTKQILFDIIENVGKCGFIVVAITSDLDGTNRDLYTELEVSMYKPWFLFKERNVYVFANVPHLIKLIRNHFIDHGFILNGKVVSKDIVLKVLSFTSDELGITHKISAKSINADRQNVKLATKLFSNTVAQAISQAVSRGLLDDESCQECYNLIKYTNDWFDIMNVRSPYSDSRETVYAYGLNLESQNVILNNMTEMITSMQVVGKNTMLPFQKGIVQSNTALQLLQKDMQDRFELSFIMTYRLNQDVLENFFGIMRGRAKGGIHDHPDRIEFKYRLRSYILGHNEGALSENSNVSIDDTSDLKLEKPFSGKMFSIVKVDKFLESEPEKDLPLAYDNLDNLAGYVCHNLKNTIPNLEDKQKNKEPFVLHIKPSKALMTQVLSLENVFNIVNGDGDGIYICAQYIKHMIDVSNKAKIVCDEKIKQRFFRSRMYSRIRKLNRDIVETKNSRKRKYE